MCQVTPFTLPCCKRVYVEVFKLPSCPDAWPTSKCPPELCLQVHGYEPQNRAFGICWRCKAASLNKTGDERELMRPAIDSADIVVGLEEIDVQERKKAVEDHGKCWFCSAKRGCEDCGAGPVTAGDIKDEEPAAVAAAPATATSNKRVRTESSAQAPRKRARKRAMVGHGRYNEQIARTASASMYPDPLLASQFHGYSYPAAQPPGCDIPFPAMETPHGGYSTFQFGGFTHGNATAYQPTSRPLSNVYQTGPDYHENAFMYQHRPSGGIHLGQHQMSGQVHMSHGQDQGAGVGARSSLNTAIYPQGPEHHSSSGGGIENTAGNLSAMMNYERRFENIDGVLINSTMGVWNTEHHPIGAQASDEVTHGYESPPEEHSTAT
ncbi:uncharacterized protein BP5553_08908 [Venustampulla echinocandica]|uniref:Uncharacterized protein n=1 Tax=Venustampulla echinocandica TaxID=2656787 RepID=A0A370TDC1_9HELO|nr:uncharacterized protein BP5553_08908 [Venustampulla echinocandica]RDL32452.1 hypothetical protein BP5553_08908 [Venustampulla echinocandica]